MFVVPIYIWKPTTFLFVMLVHHLQAKAVFLPIFDLEISTLFGGFQHTFVYSRKPIMLETGEGLAVVREDCSMEASSTTKPSFTDQHHGQQPGSSVAVLMEEQARDSKATGDQL